jgi:hypothetical protein
MPHDLIAFYPDRPQCWWWRTDCADLLGGHLIRLCKSWNKALRLVATPLDYLRDRCDVACLLRPEATSKLIGVPTIVVNVGEIAFARHIHRALRKPPAGLPKILVREDPAYALR